MKNLMRLDRRALLAPIATFAMLSLALGGCSDAVRPTDSLRHEVCDALARNAVGRAYVEPLGRTIPRQLRKLKHRDAAHYSRFAATVKEWVRQGGQNEHTPDEEFIVLARTCDPELPEQRAAVCRSSVALAFRANVKRLKKAGRHAVLADSVEACYEF